MLPVKEGIIVNHFEILNRGLDTLDVRKQAITILAQIYTSCHPDL